MSSIISAVVEASKGRTAEQPSAFKSLRAAAFGNMLEWFDWTLYGTFAVYLGANFFEKQDPTSALLSVLAVFAAGFVGRPIGGILFGRIGDRLGRKGTLISTMTTMAAASLMMAIIPPYAEIGVWASLLLLLARLVQGIAHGGETGVSYAYISEIAPATKRGLWASSSQISATIGVMCATTLGIILTSVFDQEAMMAYGWRIGFAVGALLGLYALYLRRASKESPVFEHAEAEAGREATQDVKQSTILMKIILFSAGSNVGYYTWVTFASSYAVTTHGMDAHNALIASLCAQFVALFFLPFFGHLSDRIGRKKMLTIYGITLILAPMPISAVLSAEPWTLFVSQSLGLFVWAMLASYYPTLLAEQVPTQKRAFGIGFFASLSVAIFGGTAPYLNTWLGSIGLAWVFSAYLMALGAMAIVAAVIIKETARIPMSDIFKK